ncbi:SitI3 family protein [Paractinoplanes durhamensis]|uniref:Uncharacterized protein n=1 Tax=Paractinoplanes durhamensis TaxID=113563 RepID=A0ABQ3YY65_9ACTN|nr:SitI3 family protein [Actinoplanes durhamensis]GIE02523.1 hypothetical protein Adu01nite_38730 [Actinoplanes durhamensis]
MAIEYDLVLGGSTPIELVAARAFPALAERPTGVVPLLSAALFEPYGFEVTVLAEDDAYVEAASDQGRWEWEPVPSVSVGFRLGKAADPEWAVANMLSVVRRLLDSGDEDAALVLNSDLLVLVRADGKVVKHHRETWWSSYPAADQLIPG